MAQQHGKRWTEVFARQILAEQESSGLSVAAFARRRGLYANRLRWWRKQLGVSGPPALLPVRVVEDRAPVAGLEVLLRSGHTLRFGGPVDVAALLRLLEGPC